jgi:hypothetical protein
LALRQGGAGPIEVEAKACPWPVPEAHRAEACGVRVHPLARNAEVLRELGGSDEGADLMVVRAEQFSKTSRHRVDRRQLQYFELVWARRAHLH